MRKTIRNILVALSLVFVLSVPAYAANKVDSIDVKALINQDGSMHITQIWQGTFKEGTENYIPMNAPNYLTISELKVSDKNGTYETVEDWDVDWSFKGKANKSGINYTKNGYEICFGISEYGENTYTLEYKLDNVVAAYEDMDGVNFRFVNDEMNTTPTDVQIEIRMADGSAITDEIADIWAFGFDGNVVFNSGAIKATTTNPINSDGHVTVMFALDKGIISPSRTENTSFETVKDKAFEGSDYEQDSGPNWFLIAVAMLIVAIVVVIVIVAIIENMAEKKRMKEFSESVGYFRDIPNANDMDATYTLSKMFRFCEEGAILAARMLKLIDLGALVPIVDEEIGFLGRAKETVNLQLNGERSSMNAHEKELYEILRSAAGSDGILQAKELERYAGKRDKILRRYIDSCGEAGYNYLSEKHCVNSWNMPSKIKYLTDSGKKELGELIGFKKYLQDFSLVEERGVKEVPIWKDMLIYAMLFGIADRVSEQLKELYPHIVEEVDIYTQQAHTAYSYHYILYNSMRVAEQKREAARSSGSGGSSSFGGGGGSIGGGSGGGSR